MSFTCTLIYNVGPANVQNGILLIWWSVDGVEGFLSTSIKVGCRRKHLPAYPKVELYNIMHRFHPGWSNCTLAVNPF